MHFPLRWIAAALLVVLYLKGNAKPFYYPDADGIVVIPSGKAEEILEKSRAVVNKEREIRERIEKGETLYNLLKLDGVPESVGMKK